MDAKNTRVDVTPLFRDDISTVAYVALPATSNGLQARKGHPLLVALSLTSSLTQEKKKSTHLISRPKIRYASSESNHACSVLAFSLLSQMQKILVKTFILLSFGIAGVDINQFYIREK